MSRRPIVEVEWVDAMATQGWDSPQRHLRGTGRCRTVGYLLERNKAHVILLQSECDHNGEVGESLAIPAPCIKRMRRLK